MSPSSELSLTEHLNLFDIAIIVFFIALFLALPRWFTIKNKSRDEDFLLMGRGLTLPLFIATLTSSWYGGIFGVTQIAFQQGIYSFFTQGIFWYFAYTIFAIFLVKKIRQKKVMSLPQLIGHRFGEGARKLSAVILFFHALPVTYAISVGLFFQILLGIDFFWAQALGVLIVAIYSAHGGLKGVVITDCLQFILMFIAVIMTTLFCINNFGLSYLSEQLPPSYFVWHGEQQISSALIWLFIACSTTLIHPVFYQRCLAAKSDSVALRGIFLSMIFWLIFDLCTMLGGMYAKALLPHSNSATSYLSLGMLLLPHGLKGLFLSGILATILSTLDSFMLVSGASLSYDLIKKKSFATIDAHKLAIFVSALTVIAIGGIFGSNFEAIWLFVEGALSTTMLVPVIVAVLYKKSLGGRHFFLPTIGSFSTFVLSSLLYRYELITIEPFYLAHMMSLLLFSVVLKANAHSYTKITNFADG